MADGEEGFSVAACSLAIEISVGQWSSNPKLLARSCFTGTAYGTAYGQPGGSVLGWLESPL